MTAALARRPTGVPIVTTGWILLAIGAALLVLGMILPTFSDTGSSGSLYVPATLPTVNRWKWPAIVGGAALVNVGLLFWALGSIVRALFFLPGREVALSEIEPTAYSPAPATSTFASTVSIAPSGTTVPDPHGSGAGDKFVMIFAAVILVVLLIAFAAAS